MTKKILKTLRSVGPSGLPRAALEKGEFYIAKKNPEKTRETLFTFRIHSTELLELKLIFPYYTTTIKRCNFLGQGELQSAAGVLCSYMMSADNDIWLRRCMQM